MNQVTSIYQPTLINFNYYSKAQHFKIFLFFKTLSINHSLIFYLRLIMRCLFYIIQLINERKIINLMHHPPKKTSKTIKSQFVMGTALLIGRQLLEGPRIKEQRLRQNKHARSLVNKQKFMSKLQDTNLSITKLKVDGKQINSAFNVQSFKLNNRSKNATTTKIFAEDPLSATAALTKQKNTGEVNSYKIRNEFKEEPSHSYPNILTDNEENLKQSENTICQKVTLPQINNKQYGIYSNPPTDKKTYKYRSSQRQSEGQTTSMRKISKRRDTVIETSLNYKQKAAYKTQDTSKSKPQIKKLMNLLQYREFLLTITLSNRLIIFPEEEIQYKAYVGKGNNGLLVKSIIKTRPWWTFRTSNDLESCHLVWTQWKRNKSINQLILKTHQGPNKLEPYPYKLNIKTGNKEIREKMIKRYSNFQKLVGKNTFLCKKYEDSIVSENYLTCSQKLNTKAIQQTIQKSFVGEDYNLYNKEIDKKIVNHIPGCFYLHSKKLLFLSMSKYYEKKSKDVFSVIPMTFLITKGLNDPQFQKFCKYFQEIAQKNKNQKKGSNIWICKPGQNSNRGHGIEVVSSIAEIRSLVGQKCGTNRTLIIQKYIQNPYLYNKRKFDIRCYILITCVNGCVKGYWYEQGYVRTTSEVYTLKNLDNKLIHLTNDAIQKKGDQYGKFQNFNKVSFTQMEKYIEANTQQKFKTIYEKIKTIATELIESVSKKINPQHKQFCFQVFGLDFMLDDKLNTYLIEANSNPCLEVDGNVLGKVIPKMIENVIRVAIDPIFPPPYSQTTKNRFSPGSTFQGNRFALVYDSLHDLTGIEKEEVVDQMQADEQCQQFQGEIQE